MEKRVIKKEDLINVISIETGYTKKDTKEFIEATEKVIKDLLHVYDKIDWSGLMSFEVVEVEGRNHRVPHTGEVVFKEKHKTVKCKLKPAVKKMLED